MAADNDLSADALNDLEEMKQGFSETGVRLIVFVDISGEAPYLSDFIDKVFPNADKSAFQVQLEKTVLYKAHTPAFLEEYQILTYCRLSSYIPLPGRTDLNGYYQTLQWFADSGYEMFFNLINTNVP
jgi:hypothetical protein